MAGRYAVPAGSICYECTRTRDNGVCVCVCLCDVSRTAKMHAAGTRFRSHRQSLMHIASCPCHAVAAVEVIMLPCRLLLPHTHNRTARAAQPLTAASSLWTCHCSYPAVTAVYARAVRPWLARQSVVRPCSVLCTISPLSTVAASGSNSSTMNMPLVRCCAAASQLPFVVLDYSRRGQSFLPSFMLCSAHSWLWNSRIESCVEDGHTPASPFVVVETLWFEYHAASPCVSW
eukprot:scpid61600/ scgid10975/ 